MKIGISLEGYINGALREKSYVERAKIGSAKIKQHGYDCIDFQYLVNTESELFSVDDEEYKQILTDCGNAIRDNGLEISQTHGPWRYPICDFTEENRSERFEKMAKGIVGTKYLGCKNFVVHYIMPYGNVDEDFDKVQEINLDYFSRLEKIAKDNDVIICIENMPFTEQKFASPKETLNLVKMLDSKNVRMCLDTGHSACLGIDPADAVKTIGKDYLYALHIHDNDGAHDCHWLPGDGVIDWTSFGKALNEIGFDGSVSLETSAKSENEQELEEKRIALFNTVNKIVNY